MGPRATINVPESTGRDGAMDHVVKRQNSGRAGAACRHLFSGEKGSWYLAKDVTGVYIVFIPDLATGRDVRRMNIEDVLVAGGPERRELLQLIGTLVD
ncbi:MAG: hypothetical protein K2Y71_00805 [Xanthobacteraceae bacterium]|nr:hypothetical protein [Xanthobacteraceae bacterium]